MTVMLAGKPVGADAPVYMTFEAGPTHEGVESAKRLVEAAAKSGGDAIKFQIIDAERLVADQSVEITYSVLADRETGALETVTEPLIEPLRQRMLTPNEWRDVKKHADDHGLAFFATVCFDDEVDFVKELGVHSIKIASADIDQLPFIERAAHTGLCIQLDTGNATIGEVEAAVDTIRATGNENIIIHHCPTGYPARLEGINLEIIATLRRMFDYPIAFSDHSPGWEMDIAAVTLGANLIEKTLTENRMTRGIEHVMSLEPDVAGQFVTAIRELEVALGTRRRILHEQERKNRLTARRSAYAERDLAAGERPDEGAIVFRRPGFGISATQWPHFSNRPLARAVSSGSALSPEDFG